MADPTQPVQQEVSLLNPNLDNLDPDQINSLTEMEVQERFLDTKVEMDGFTNLSYGTTNRARWKRGIEEIKTSTLTAQEIQLMNLVGPHGALGNFEVARKFMAIQIKLRQSVAELVRRLEAEKVESAKKAKQGRTKSMSRPNGEHKNVLIIAFF